jgi:hypothetical protein
MMTTNWFVIANVKHLRTYAVLNFYCLFSRTSWCVGVLKSAIFFSSFHNRVDFGTIFWRPFGIWGGLNTRNPPPRRVRHCRHLGIHCHSLTPGITYSALQHESVVCAACFCERPDPTTPHGKNSWLKWAMIQILKSWQEMGNREPETAIRFWCKQMLFWI